MRPLPVTDLRRNLGTWAVSPPVLPAAGAALCAALPVESFDPDFSGQGLTTTYFDTQRFALRQARARGVRYLTLRLRRYGPPGAGAGYALSAKTESAKWRLEVPRAEAEAALDAADVTTWAASRLPGDLRARLIDLTGAERLLAVVAVSCRRYACEDAAARLTLDVGVATDTDLVLPFHVLELKATDPGTPAPAFVDGLGLRPIKVSKFLWATGGGR
jgi:hypothetical protein